MTQIQVHHQHPCDIHTFWRLFLDESFNQHLYEQVLGYRYRKLLKLEETETGWIRHIELSPQARNVPRVLRKFSDGIVYREEGTCDLARNRHTVKIFPNKFPERLDISATLQVEIINPQIVRRTVTATVNASVPVIGKAIEKQICSDFAEGYTLGAEHFNQHLRSSAAAHA